MLKGEPENYLMNYGKAFRIIRAAFGLSQAELSSMLRIGQSQISLIEAGKRQPSHAVINDLANGLKIPQPLLILLASEPKDVNLQGSEIEALAQSLLRLLVSASDEAVQRPLQYTDPPKKT